MSCLKTGIVMTSFYYSGFLKHTIASATLRIFQLCQRSKCAIVTSRQNALSIVIVGY